MDTEGILRVSLGVSENESKTESVSCLRRTDRLVYEAKEIGVQSKEGIRRTRSVIRRDRDVGGAPAGLLGEQTPLDLR